MKNYLQLLLQFFEANAGFEPACWVLQTHACPLGQMAVFGSLLCSLQEVQYLKLHNKRSYLYKKN